MKKLVAVVAFIVAVASLASAADVSGTWVGDVPRRDGGADKTTFELKIDGDMVGGTVTTPVATYQIKGGRVDGNDLEFYIGVNMGREVRFTYTGKVNGEEIVFSREIQGMAIRTSFVAKRPK